MDGFLAGTVDEFDGMFQSLPVEPGGHEIVGTTRATGPSGSSST